MSSNDEAKTNGETAITVARLERLQSLLDRNRNAYYRAIDSGRGLSGRMYGWIDEYNEARGCAAWVAFCKKHGLAMWHTALDALA